MQPCQKWKRVVYFGRIKGCIYPSCRALLIHQQVEDSLYTDVDVRDESACAMPIYAS